MQLNLNTDAVEFGTAISVHLLRSQIDGPRIVENRTSPLQIHAGPWEELQALLDASMPTSPGVYILTRPVGTKIAARPGEAGDVRRRLVEHGADPTKDKYEEVYSVTSVDGRLTKSDARFLEARLHEILASAPHAELEVEKVPAVGACRNADRAYLEALLHQARDLLYVAGCRALDAPRCGTTVAPDDAEDGADIQIVETSVFGEDEHALSYDGLWSWGHTMPDGRFVVRAGSDVRRRENTALLPGVAERRRRLAALGVLGEMPGVTDRWRLLCNVVMPSPLLAAKVVTGAHISNKGIWQRVAPSARMVAMDGR